MENVLIWYKKGIWKREYDKAWTIGEERKYLNLSTLMYDAIESCWYLILRAISFLLHLTLIHDYNSYPIVNCLIALVSCLILLCFHCHCELFDWQSWCQGLYIYDYGYLGLYNCAWLTYKCFIDITFDFLCTYICFLYEL